MSDIDTYRAHNQRDLIKISQAFESTTEMPRFFKKSQKNVKIFRDCIILATAIILERPEMLKSECFS